MFLLYRIYDLAPVKYENLRPEKARKAPEADADPANMGGAEEDEDPIRRAPGRSSRICNVQSQGSCPSQFSPCDI